MENAIYMLIRVLAFEVPFIPIGRVMPIEKEHDLPLILGIFPCLWLENPLNAPVLAEINPTGQHQCGDHKGQFSLYCMHEEYGPGRDLNNVS